MDVMNLVRHPAFLVLPLWVDCTMLLQQTDVQHDAAPAAQPSLVQQAFALHGVAQQNMAESVESPEASRSDANPAYNPPPTLIPHFEDVGPSPFVSPKKQKTDTGHAVSLSSCMLRAGPSCMHSKHPFVSFL